MTASRTWMTVAVTAGVLCIGCSTPPATLGEDAPKYALNGAYTIENLATFSQDNLDVRIAALDRRDESRSVFFSFDEPVGVDSCVDRIVQTLTEQGLPASLHGDLILIERTQRHRVRAAAAPSPEPSEPSEHDAHVTKVGDWSYTIDGAYFGAEVTDLDGIMRQGRVIPHRDGNGETDGYRISGLRRSSMGDALGLSNGDILHSVSGQSLDSVQGAMDAYQILQDADQFTVEITRRGQRQTISYEVQ